MTEAEWLACADPGPMLEFLRGKVNGRKLRLFAYACCLRVLDLMADIRSRLAVEISGQFADGLCRSDELGEAHDAAQFACFDISVGHNGAAQDAASAAFWVSYRADGFVNADGTPLHVMDGEWSIAATTSDHAAKAAARSVGYFAEKKYQCGFVHDIFGPLAFRPTPIDPAWLCWNAGTVPAIAHRIYDERHFEDMPILADALEDAGCADAAILDHCRGPRPHVRGCWVLDLLLGKE
jgi:hypothetical protein